MSRRRPDIDNPPAVSSAERPASPAEAATALDKIMPEIVAISDENLRRITFDVPRAVSIALAAHPRVLALRSKIIEYLPKTPLAYVDGLDKYALAAWYAHLSALPKPESTLDALIAEATSLRTDLLVASDALAHKKFFSKSTLVTIRAGSGKLDLANDAVALSALYASAWDRIHDKTCVEWRQVERAAIVGPQLIVMLGEKIGFGKTPSEASKIRARAATLLLDVYDELERAMTYLRWHEDDLDTVLPSLYGPRGGGRKPEAKPDATPQAASPAADPVATAAPDTTDEPTG